MVVDVLKPRKKTNLKKKRNTLESIPGELLMEIVGRVASDSCQDLLNTKLSCKTLNEIGDDESIFRRVSLDKFPVITPPKSMASFLHRCYKAGNSEAIYRLGIKHYFENKDMEFLWRAANLGNSEAKYMIGIILILLHGGEAKQKGMKIIFDLKKSKISRHGIREIRKKFQSILKSYFRWSNKKSMVEHIRPICCTMHEHVKLMIDTWDGYEDVDSECQACRCDQELIHLWEPGATYAQHLLA